MKRRWIVVCLGVLCLLLAVSAALPGCSREEISLPEGAHNVKRERLRNVICYSFSITEERFLVWASTLGFKRYQVTQLGGNHGETRAIRGPGGGVVIKNGYLAWRDVSRRGGSITIGFDRESGLAYYCETLR
jgi:hypothetical protein